MPDTGSPLLYTGIVALLFLFETAYLKLARRFSINDEPQLRSSHSVAIPTGGGIVLYLAVLISAAMSGGTLWILPCGCTVLAVVSYIDDLRPQPPLLRLAIQMAVSGWVFSSIMYSEPFAIILLTVLAGTGVLNAYNFMDGINGMLATYSLVFLGTMLYYVHGLAALPAKDTVESLLICLAAATFVLGIFNFRRQALVFSGDVGSITMGFCAMFMIAFSILHTGDPTIAVFLSVYAVDTIYTLLQRLLAGERITQAHRKHLYQHLVHRRGYSHLRVSTAYAATQLAINLLYLALPNQLHWPYVCIVLIALSTTYFLLKK